MSDMLEQAIIDATALKEAAVKNAETLVLEKYSNQIKSAVESLLEQEDPLAALAAVPAGTADPAAAMGGSIDTTDPAAADFSAPSVLEHIPLAATTKTDEPVEIPLDKLMEEIKAVKQQIQFDGDLITESDFSLDEELDEELDESILAELEEELAFEELDEELGEDLEEDLSEDLDEEIDLTEEDLSAMMEHLTVDVKNHLAKSGWAGRPESGIQLAEEELLALEQDTKMKEERAAMRKAVKALEEINESVTKQNTKLQESVVGSANQIKKLTKVANLLKEKLDKVNLMNARLLYQNKALNSDSLNERQKHKLVEAVSNAETIEEARVIYETLQSTVGSTSQKTSQPKSLSEAVQKTSSIILSSSRKESERRQNSDPTFNRWKFLAGIDNSK